MKRHPLALATLTSGLALFAASAPAHALSCAVPGGGITVDRDVIAVCPFCALDEPAATAVQVPGATTEEPFETFGIQEVERAGLVRGGVAFRYRAEQDMPDSALALDTGSFELWVPMTARLGAPQVPVARLTGYQMADGAFGSTRVALIEMSGVNGMLVADEGEPDDDPMLNVEHAWRQDYLEDFTFRFGRDLCASSLATADYRVSTRVRFGTLAPSGEFSGWGDWIDVNYPGVLGSFVVDDAGALFVVNPETQELTPANEASVTALPPAGDEPAPANEPEPIQTAQAGAGNGEGLVGVDGNANGGGCALAPRVLNVQGLAGGSWIGLVLIGALRRRRAAERRVS